MRVSGKNPNRAYMSWSFTSMCNFECSYCPEFLHDGKTPFPEYEDAMYLIDLMHEKNEEVFLDLSGGETTMWPRLPQFLRTAAAKHPKFVVEVNTNGSRTRKWWERFVKLGLQKNVVLNLSYHAAMCDPDLFYDNVKIASEAGYSCTANFMLDPPYFDISRKLYERTKELNVYTTMKTLRPNFESGKLIDGYTDEMLDYIVKSHKEVHETVLDNAPGVDDDLRIFYDGIATNFQEAIINKRHSFTFWSCSAGRKRVIIDLLGDVYVCYELAKTTDSKYYLGNIHKRNVKLLDEDIVCSAKYCGCLLDALVEKHE